MRTKNFENLDLLEFGNSIHLRASLWQDSITGDIYIIDLDHELIDESKLVAITFKEDEQKRKLFRQADMVECRIYDGEKRNEVKAIIKKSHAQIDVRIMWQVFRRDNFTCRYCGRNQLPLTYDHWIPRSVGGETTLDNGRAACRKCNNLKADMTPEEWLVSKAYKKIMEQKGKNHR